MTGNFARTLFVLLPALIFSACAGGQKIAGGPPPGPDPLNATYTIEDHAVLLVNGRFSEVAAPGLETWIRAAVFGGPLHGDLDQDADDDAVVVIVYDPGGPGTFYYIAAAINQDGGYRGTAGYRLGDRIIVQTVEYRNGGLLVRYLDRRPTEPMSAPPTVRTEVRLQLTGGKLAPVTADTAEPQVLEGWVTLGHNVRSFLPCSAKTAHWLVGISPALQKIAAAYSQALPRAKRYTPLFMSLAGHIAPAPSAGSGADYGAGFYATGLVEVRPAGNCRDAFIEVASPQPGDIIVSPLRIRGRARGTWFFEGDFPLVLKGPRGGIVARGFATARGDWLTNEFVPFEATLKFKGPAGTGWGMLVFIKDNPTGRPELDDAMELPVRF